MSKPAPVAARGGGFGLDKELAAKANGKYDINAEQSVKIWIEIVTQDAFDAGKSFAENLKNGQLLCKLINAIKPGQIKKIETSSMPFKQMENISQFLKAARSVGVAEFDVFETVDLFDEKDIGSVVRCLLALSRAVQKTTPSFSGPFVEVTGAPNITGVALLEKALAGTSVSSSGGGSGGGAGPSSSSSTATTSASPTRPSNSNVNSNIDSSLKSSNSSSPSITNTVFQKVNPTPSPVGARGAGFGLDAELARKNQDKYDPKSESEAREWIEQITGDKFGDMSFAARLKSGELLCKLINSIKPGTITKVNNSTMPFKQMENISSFLKAARTLGLAEHDLFETVDLYDEKDLNVVVLCIFALGRTVQNTVPEFAGPTLGPRLAAANQRNFTAEQLSAGKTTATFISSGSSATMERTQISTAGSVTFGADKVGVGDSSSTSKINHGSVQTMGRTEISKGVASNITFGHDASTSK